MITIPGMSDQELWDRGADTMASLACHAATELDCFRLNQAPRVFEGYITLLLRWFEGAFEGEFVDPSNMILLFNALGRERSGLRTVPELQERVREIGSRLEAVLEDPVAHRQEVIELRDFCVELSRQASAFESWRRRW